MSSYIDDLEQYKEYLEENENNSVLSADMFNVIETGLSQIISELSSLYNIYIDSQSKTWNINEFVSCNDFIKIIETLNKIKDITIKFNNWKDLNIYIDSDTIIYNELIEVIDDILLIIDNIDDIANYNIWNYIYLLNWDEDSTIEWEE